MFLGTGEPVILVTWAALYTGFAVPDGHGNPSVRGGVSVVKGGVLARLLHPRLVASGVYDSGMQREVDLCPQSSWDHYMSCTYIQQQVLRYRKHSYGAASKIHVHTKAGPDIWERIGHSLDRTKWPGCNALAEAPNEKRWMWKAHSI